MPSGRQGMKKELKSVSVNFRASPKFKEMLTSAAAMERRSQANLLEMLLFSYCEQKGLPVSGTTHTNINK
jgi:hypothetical protein